MSRSPLSDDQLAELIDWNHESYTEHFDSLNRLFESLSSPEEIVALARSWWADPDERVRALGFDLLAVQALDYSWHVLPLIEAANGLALDTTPEVVRASAAHALATICDDERVLFPLLRFAADPEADIRWQVARGIPVGVDPLPEDRSSS